jgi:hypothetical protein
MTEWKPEKGIGEMKRCLPFLFAFLNRRLFFAAPSIGLMESAASSDMKVNFILSYSIK